MNYCDVNNLYLFLCLGIYKDENENENENENKDENIKRD